VRNDSIITLEEITIQQSLWNVQGKEYALRVRRTYKASWRAKESSERGIKLFLEIAGFAHGSNFAIKEITSIALDAISSDGEAHGEIHKK
jgi:hypothetical protein